MDVLLRGLLSDKIIGYRLFHGNNSKSRVRHRISVAGCVEVQSIIIGEPRSAITYNIARHIHRTLYVLRKCDIKRDASHYKVTDNRSIISCRRSACFDGNQIGCNMTIF